MHAFHTGNILPLTFCQGYALELQPATAPQTDTSTMGQIWSKSASKQQQEQQQRGVHHVDSQQDTGKVQSPSTLGCHQEAARPAEYAQFPAGGPSLVGANYMGVQGSHQICVGATKQYGVSPEEALRECGRQVTCPEEVARAEAMLRPKAEGLWSPAAAWQVT